jgi:hypothetical protein
MIARIWHGWTSRQDADAYQHLLLTTIFPGIEARSIAGYRGIRLDRREVPEGVEFVTTMLFSSLEAVAEFAGPAYAASVVPSAARALLSRYDANAAHYEIVHLSPSISP